MRPEASGCRANRSRSLSHPGLVVASGYVAPCPSLCDPRLADPLSVEEAWRSSRSGSRGYVRLIGRSETVRRGRGTGPDYEEWAISRPGAGERAQECGRWPLGGSRPPTAPETWHRGGSACRVLGPHRAEASSVSHGIGYEGRVTIWKKEGLVSSARWSWGASWAGTRDRSRQCNTLVYRPGDASSCRTPVVACTAGRGECGDGGGGLADARRDSGNVCGPPPAKAR